MASGSDFSKIYVNPLQEPKKIQLLIFCYFGHLYVLFKTLWGTENWGWTGFGAIYSAYLIFFTRSLFLKNRKKWLWKAGAVGELVSAAGCLILAFWVRPILRLEESEMMRWIWLFAVVMSTGLCIVTAFLWWNMRRYLEVKTYPSG